MDYTNESTNVGDVSRTAKNKASQVKDTINQTMDQAQDRIQRLSDQLFDVSQQLRARADEVRTRTSETVSRHPFYSIGAAAVAGIAIGLLFSRKK